MKSKPILFSAPMVRAILDGTKTQTRRIVKPQPFHGEIYEGQLVDENKVVPCPYEVGMTLWVKETFKQVPVGNHVVYRADEPRNRAETIDHAYGPWKPSIFMPRALSRITLEITGIKVERVQDIGKDGRKAHDVLAEGITKAQIENWAKWLHPDDAPAHTYGCLWESINGKGSWVKNPFVWCLQFQNLPTSAGR